MSLNVNIKINMPILIMVTFCFLIYVIQFLTTRHGKRGVVVAMEYLPETRCLKMRPDTLTAVRQNVNLHKPGEMKRAVQILHEWIQQQAHFNMKDFPPAYLEATIINNKGSLERAKTMIDRMCTVRTLTPRFFAPFDVRKEYEKYLRGHAIIVASPHLTEEYYRIVFLKFSGKIASSELVDRRFRLTHTALEYLRLHDYHSGVVIVYDLTDADMADAVTNLNLIEIKNWYTIFLESYGVRVKRIHAITPSRIIETAISIFKTFVKKKLTDRIVISRSYEELHQYYPKEILPKDYGGEQESISTLQEIALEELASEEHEEHLRRMREATVDESQRPLCQFNDMYIGTNGTFRTLTLD